MPTSEELMQLIQAQQYQRLREDLLKRNAAYSNPEWRNQMARLDPQQEQAFMQWVEQNQVPFDPKDKYPDYDMRGFYLGLMSGDPNAVADRKSTRLNSSH